MTANFKFTVVILFVCSNICDVVSEIYTVSIENVISTYNGNGNASLRPLSLWSNPDEDIHYFLYTRKNKDEFQELKINDTDLLKSSHFDFNQKTKVIVHGWLGSGTASAPQEIKDAYLQVTDDNIINVDWCKRANTFYTLSRMYVPVVSQSLTDFLIFLVDNGVRTSDLHLIGHSLGAHIVGVAGKYYERQMKPIRFISALDPAKPLFQWSNKDNRLDKSDAVHVEVIHTNGGFLGIPYPVGHLDFYPNGGRRQPGCGWDIAGSCAHNRAVLYFAESVVSAVPFTAVQCESYSEVYYNGKCNKTNANTLNMSGFNINYGSEGVYYLKTNAESPFALGSPENWGDDFRRNTYFHGSFWLTGMPILQYNILN